MHYFKQYSGVDPAYIEEFLMWIVTRVAQDFADFQEMKTSLWELRISLQNQNRFHKIKPALSHWLLEWTERAEEKRQLPETTIVQLVMNIVAQEYHQDINLRSLAERVYLSPNYLGNLLNKHKLSRQG
jgi:two-component system, response regulator YesN